MSSHAQYTSRISKVVIVVLMVSLGAAVFNVYSTIQELRFIERVDKFDQAGGPEEQLEQVQIGAKENDERQERASTGHLAAILLSLITLLVWVYNANRACRELGAEDMHFTPGWAVGYWLIPILNLFRPFQIMRELWVTSSPEYGGQRNVKSAPLIGTWWAFWLVSGALARIAATNRANEGASLAELRSADYALLAAHLIDLVAVVLTAVIVAVITRQLLAREERRTPAPARAINLPDE